LHSSLRNPAENAFLAAVRNPIIDSNAADRHPINASGAEPPWFRAL
jgi:hypothetical protein